MNYKTLSGIQPIDFLQPVINIAMQAGEEIMGVYNTNFSVSEKNDASPLTQADLKSHILISRELKKLHPDLPLLSEESAAIPYEERKNWTCYWLIDPLDGTREFIKRNGEFTVNICLIDQHIPVLGVVYIPVTGFCYYAVKNNGAYLVESENSPPRSLQTKQTTETSYIVAGSRSHSNEKTAHFFERLGKDTKIISAGSSLKFCLVAEGKVDIYPRFGPTSEWDTAAAQCLVEEAGGIVTDINFNPLIYNNKESLLNPEFLVIADPDFDWRKMLA